MPDCNFLVELTPRKEMMSTGQKIHAMTLCSLIKNNHTHNMKTKILIFLLCLASHSVMGQIPVERKCKTCGKFIAQCQYKGKHRSPQPVPTPEAIGYDVIFKCNVSSASLYIDGNANGTASGTRFLKTGSHSLKVTADGYEEYFRNITVNQQNKSFSISLTKKPDPPKTVVLTSGTLNGHEWVDLGLSVKWATCNVGANSPIDYGGYYAWGETSTKSHYDWSNCFDCLDLTGDSWGTYRLGGLRDITPSSGYDTALENWGDTWRMPTDVENDELCYNCTWTWTSRNGHNGYTVTGPNGNSIFLPAAGYRYGTGSDSVGDNGCYWSSTLSPSESFNARGLYFRSGIHNTGDYNRRSGRSIRPVTE